MAEPLKTFYDARVVESLAEDLRRAGLDPGGFAAEALRGLDALELVDRARHIARAMRPRLPGPPAEALTALVATLGAPHAGDELIGAGMEPFRYLPHAVLIAELGPAAPAVGLWACRELTLRFTAEFSVRALLDAAPDATWAAVDAWVTDPSPHVRRLVSEGLRPRLPWAPRIRSLQADPSPAIARLERLVDDPAELVRRSVANHLGDIGKDHPDVAVELGRRWLAADPRRRRLVEHGLRALVKRGHPGALAVLGYGAAAVVVEDLALPDRASLGDTVEFTLALVSRGEEPQTLVVEARVAFPTPSGRGAPRVFRLWKGALGASERRELRGRVRLGPMSTRTARPGTYVVEVVVNGAPLAAGSFVVEPAGPR